MASVSIRTLQYRARVAALQQQLGGKCAVCPATTALEFDCIIPAGPAHHALGSLGRIAFYELMHERGKIQLLCRRHHQEKSLDDSYRQRFPWSYAI